MFEKYHKKNSDKFYKKLFLVNAQEKFRKYYGASELKLNERFSNIEN